MQQWSRFVPILALCVSACANPMRSGWQSYERGDYAAALATWQPLAEAGEADAQFLVALLHDDGQGVAVDRVHAAEWYERAAAQGHAAAQNNLGLLHYRGEGVPASMDQAAKWYAEAAAQGFAKAASNLALMHLAGQAVERDGERACELL